MDHFQDGFVCRFEYPHAVTIGTDRFEDPLPIKVFIEPDESVGCTDWYCATVELDIAGGIELDKNDDGVQRILHHAYRVESKGINAKWSEWLADKPRRRRA
jgi:hypothetical protein